MNKTVLLIEDDVVLRENTAELLELSEYKVFTAPNGKIGIQKANEVQPDVIVCDIMMPEIDGYGVLESLSNNEKTAHIPFIFLSAKTEHKEVRKGMDMGADDYLTKPFYEEELISAIESRLAKAKILFANKEDQNLISVVEDEGYDIRNLHELKNYFWDEGEVSKYKKGETIYQRGDHSNNIFMILKGVVKTNSSDPNGKELITALYKADDFMGFTSLEDFVPYNEDAVAVEDTEVVQLSKSLLTDILKKNQDIALDLMNLLSDSLGEMKKQLVQMAYSSVRKKTANTILQFVEIMNTDPDAAIRISRSDLASTAGIATESLIRTLSDLKREQIIEIEGRDIRVLDLESLKEIT